MAYNNFSLSDVIEQFDLNVVASPFCENLPVAVPSEFFTTLFKEWFPLAQQARSEKAKSELLVSPVLLEVRKVMELPNPRSSTRLFTRSTVTRINAILALESTSKMS
jgi:hypothetical protein